MKIIILVAGMGSRLGVTSPKPLTLLSNNETLLGRQIDLISRTFGLADSEVILVTGFGSQEIKNSFPSLRTVFNPEFSSTNTAKSLLLGLEDVVDDVLWFNGDLFYTAEVLESVAKSVYNQIENLVFYKLGNLDEEAMKVAFETHSRNENVTEIGKQLEGLSAEAIGINFVHKSYLQIFKDTLNKVSLTSYYEEAINTSVAQGELHFRAVDLGSGFIKEIDFQIDLLEVNSFLNS